MEWLNLIASVGMSVLIAFFSAWAVLAKYREKIDQLEKREEKVQEKIENLRSDTDTLLAKVGSLERAIDDLSKLAQSHSPLALTEAGEALVKDSGFMKIFDVIKDELVEKLESQSPSSQYDVQEKARKILSWDMANDVRFEPVATWAYKNGKDLNQILRLGGLPLRDYYFEKHPEIVNSNEQY